MDGLECMELHCLGASFSRYSTSSVDDTFMKIRLGRMEIVVDIKMQLGLLISSFTAACGNVLW